MPIMRRWLGRLTFSFFIIAAFLAWEAHKLSRAGAEAWRPAIYLIAACLAVVLGLAGLRERHRPD
jgi:hypothetical protein